MGGGFNGEVIFAEVVVQWVETFMQMISEASLAGLGVFGWPGEERSVDSAFRESGRVCEFYAVHSRERGVGSREAHAATGMYFSRLILEKHQRTPTH